MLVEGFEIPRFVPHVEKKFVHKWGKSALFKVSSEDKAFVNGVDSLLSGPVMESFISPFVPNSPGGFIITDKYETRHNGVKHVYTQQIINSMVVRNGRGQLNFDAEWNLVSSFDSFWKGSVPVENSFMEARKAFEVFVMELGQGEVVPLSNDPCETAEMQYIIDGKSLVASWVFEVNIGDHEHVLEVAVDAVGGRTMQCVDLVSDADSHVEPRGSFNRKLQQTSAMYRGWGLPNITPGQGSSILEENPHAKAPDASPLGWHATSSTAFQDTRGNNVIAQENSANDGSIPPQNGRRPVSQSAESNVFDYSFDFDKDPAEEENLDAVVTNLFLMNNIIHDVLYTYGFDEQSGNFQVDNFDRGGHGNDPLVANSLDGSGTNNANMFTPGDGSAPLMRMYRWNFLPGEDRPSSLDGLVVAHEYAHGLSNRLTGGPYASGCLSSLQSGGMGEGWSDFVGIIMSIGNAERFRDAVPVGSWLVGGNGIRQFPYSTDILVNPMTFSDVNIQSGVHGVGTVWCTILFDMTAHLVEEFGFSADIYLSAENMDRGNIVAFQNIVDGMKMQPCDPHFIDARDAILLADMENYQGIHQCNMWASFARRGLGIYAVYVGESAIESFCVPDECSGGSICQETSAPTPAPYEDQFLGELEVGNGEDDNEGVVYIVGSTLSRENTYGNPAGDVRIHFTLPNSWIPEATTLLIHTCSEDTTYDSYLYLLDSRGLEIAQNDDDSACLINQGASNILSGAIFVNSALEPGGEYTLIVDGFGRSTGSFGLTLSLQNMRPTSVPTIGPPTLAPASNECTVTVALDDYPGETSYTVCDSAGDCILSEGPFPVADAGTSKMHDLILDPVSEYTFIINDSYGDGICCDYGEGSYAIACGGALVATGGDFGYVETIVFTTSGDHTTPLTPHPTAGSSTAPTISPTLSPPTPPPPSASPTLTAAPTIPTVAPTAPTSAPSSSPSTLAPSTTWPSATPTQLPTEVPTEPPTRMTTTATSVPTPFATFTPTEHPTSASTQTAAPTPSPTFISTHKVVGELFLAGISVQEFSSDRTFQSSLKFELATGAGVDVSFVVFVGARAGTYVNYEIAFESKAEAEGAATRLTDLEGWTSGAGVVVSLFSLTVTEVDNRPRPPSDGGGRFLNSEVVVVASVCFVLALGCVALLAVLVRRRNKAAAHLEFSTDRKSVV